VLSIRCKPVVASASATLITTKTAAIDTQATHTYTHARAGRRHWFMGIYGICSVLLFGMSLACTCSFGIPGRIPCSNRPPAPPPRLHVVYRGGTYYPVPRSALSSAVANTVGRRCKQRRVVRAIARVYYVCVCVCVCKPTSVGGLTDCAPGSHRQSPGSRRLNLSEQMDSPISTMFRPLPRSFNR